MSHDLVELVRGLRPENADRVDEVFPRERRIEICEEIISCDRPITAEPAQRGPAPSRRTGRWGSSKVRRSRRPVLLSTLGAVATLAVAAAVLITNPAVGPQSASAAVVFRTAADGDIVATVIDPFAAQSDLQAAFAEHGLDITVNLVPVSPSLVGTVIYTSDNGGASAIQPLQGGTCVTGGGGCAIGVKIPSTFTGQGYITLGRPAKPGETYESQTSAFAPGEVLHCSGLLGARVATALPVLQADKLTITWRESKTGTGPDGTSAGFSSSETAPPANEHIWDALMTAPGMIMIWTDPKPWPADSAHGAGFNQGC
jgi:hypothetical protein